MNEEDLLVEGERLRSLQEEITRLYERGLMSQRTYQRRLTAITQKLAECEQQT